MKNKILLALALVVFSYSGFAQNAAPVTTTQQATISPMSDAMLSLLKSIKMENISQSWSASADAWMQKVTTATDAAASSKLIGELSNAVSPDAMQPSFKTNKAKWEKQNARVNSMATFKKSLKDFAAGINPTAFIPEFNLAEWTAKVDAL